MIIKLLTNLIITLAMMLIILKTVWIAIKLMQEMITLHLAILTHLLHLWIVLIPNKFFLLKLLLIKILIVRQKN